MISEESRDEGSFTKLEGKYVKKARSGSDMYDSSDLMEVADQTDYGYIFVSPSLAKGKNGTLTLAVRQLGDSEGAWWLEDTFSCKIAK